MLLKSSYTQEGSWLRLFACLSTDISLGAVRQSPRTNLLNPHASSAATVALKVSHTYILGKFKYRNTNKPVDIDVVSTLTLHVSAKLFLHRGALWKKNNRKFQNQHNSQRETFSTNCQPGLLILTVYSHKRWSPQGCKLYQTTNISHCLVKI